MRLVELEFHTRHWHLVGLAHSLWDAPSPPHRSGTCLCSGAHPGLFFFFSFFLLSSLFSADRSFSLTGAIGGPSRSQMRGGCPPFFTMVRPSAHKRVVRRCSHPVRLFSFSLSFSFADCSYFFHMSPSCSPLHHASRHPSSSAEPTRRLCSRRTSRRGGTLQIWNSPACISNCRTCCAVERALQTPSSYCASTARRPSWAR